MNLEEKIELIYDDVVRIRRKLHMSPELSEMEEKTAKLISDELTKIGVKHIEGVAGHGIVALIEGKGSIKVNQKHTVIGLRADIDALPIQECVESSFKSTIPGVMHACGHDIHTASLLGAARILKEIEDELPGKVKLFFEPAEETVGGAKRMIEEGHMENPKVNAVIAFHVAPYLPSGHIEFKAGTLNAASTEFKIEIIGETCHGAHPQTGLDVILIASSIIQSFQSIPSRNLSPTTPGIVTVGSLHAGKVGNIIPGVAEMEGILRALNAETLNFIKDRVESLTKSIAEAYGATAKITFIDSYPALINDEEITAVISNFAEKNFPKERIHFMKEPSLGADDFSYFASSAPSSYFHIGTTKENETKPQKLHSEWFNPDEEAMKTAIFMEVGGVLEILGLCEV